MTWTQHEDALVALWPSLNETPSPGVTTNMLRWEPFEVASSISAGHEASAVSTCSKSDMTDLMVPGPVARGSFRRNCRNYTYGGYESYVRREQPPLDLSPLT